MITYVIQVWSGRKWKDNNEVFYGDDACIQARELRASDIQIKVRVIKRTVTEQLLNEGTGLLEELH